MPLDLQRIKGLCFDVDGTISDTDDAWVEKVNRCLNPIAKAFKRQEPRRLARWLVMASESPMNLVMYWLDTLSLDDNFARLFTRMMKRREYKNTAFRLMRGANELLTMAEKKYPLAVVSARDEKTTMMFLEQFSLSKHFVEVVTSQTCERTKPYPMPVQHAANAMGLQARDCVMIGDTTVDILAGRRAGAQTVGLLCGFGTEKELKKAGADVVLNDLEELQALLFPVGGN